MAQFTNQAQLSYLSAFANSNLAVGEVQSTLRMTKTALQETYAEGETLVYAITITNAGTSAVSGVSLTDNLGAYMFGNTTLYPLTYQADSLLYYINGVQQPAPTVSDTQPLTITGLQIPAGGVVMLLYRVTVNMYAPLSEEAQIINRSVLTGNFCSETITASAVVTAASGPSLVISKSIVPVPVLENGELTYTFVILNIGNVPATVADQVAISDLFQPVLKDIRVSLDGTVWTTPAQYTYNETTGQFNTVPGQITVPAATYTQNPETGVWSVTPGSVTLLVSGTIC